MLVASEIPLSRTWHLSFAEKRNKDIDFLIETHINHDQTHHIRKNWLGPIFFCPKDSHTKGLLVLFYLSLEGINEVGTDPKGRFVSFKVTPFNDRFLCVYAPSGCNTREKLAKGCLFEGL